MNTRTLILAMIALFAGNALAAQNYQIDFYSFPNRNSESAGMQRLSNGDLLLLYQNYCYTPGSIVIEGCPLEKGARRLANSGDIIWGQNVTSGSGWFYPYTVEQSDESITIFHDRNLLSGVCEGILALNGFDLPEAYRLSSSGELLNSNTYEPDDCSSVLGFGVASGSDSKVLFANYGQPVLSDGIKYTWFYKLKPDNTVQSRVTLPEYYGGAIGVSTGPESYIVAYYDANSIFRLSQMDVDGYAMWTSDSTSGIGYLRNIKVLSNGNILIISSFYDTNVSAEVVSLSMFNNQGVVKWSKNYQAKPLVAAVAERSGGSLLLALSAKLNTSPDQSEILINCIDTTGETIGSKTYNISPGIDYPSALIAGDGDDFILYGTAYGFNLDTSTGPARTFLLRDTLAIATNTSEVSFPNLIIAPNPATDYIYLRNAVPGARTYLHDSLGRTFEAHPNQDGKIDIRNLTPGFYIVGCIDRNGRRSSGKFLKW